MEGGRLGFRMHVHDVEMVLRMALGESGCHAAADVRAAIQAAILNTTNADSFGQKRWDNYYVGGQFREEDSPGNYVLRETNNMVKLIPMGPAGREDDRDALDLPLQK